MRNSTRVGKALAISAWLFWLPGGSTGFKTVADEKSAAKSDATSSLKSTSDLDRATLEKRFGDQLSGATMVGTFTIDGSKKTPQEERYTISKVSKVAGDKWLFMARVQYMNHDVTVPMTLDVLWAGDTPIITLTDLNIPGLGTFTARVMVYGDRYAGTWQHGPVGGHMWGRIERAAPVKPSAPTKAENDNPGTTVQTRSPSGLTPRVPAA